MLVSQAQSVAEAKKDLEEAASEDCLGLRSPGAWHRSRTADLAAGQRRFRKGPGGRFPLEAALLRKSPDGPTSAFPEQTYPLASVMGVPLSVKPFSTATRTWNSAS